MYFVTLCVDHRSAALADPLVFAAIKAAIAQLRNWSVLAGVIMPDHVHFIVTPREQRGLSVGDFTNGFKRVVRRHLVGPTWQWQRGCFDRLLRSDENLASKWIYLRDNPVRAGLVARAEDWPYFIDLVNSAEVPVGDAASVPSHTTNEPDGKLTASPTETESEPNR